MILIFIIALLIIGADQLSKLFIVGFFIDKQAPLYTGMLEFEGDTVSLIDKTFSFTYVLNEGAAFGVLQNQRLFFLKQIDHLLRLLHIISFVPMK